MDADEISEQAWNTLEDFVDGETLRAKIGPREAAEIYRGLASECRDRASGLDEEADALEGTNEGEE